MTRWILLPSCLLALVCGGRDAGATTLLPVSAVGFENDVEGCSPNPISQDLMTEVASVDTVFAPRVDTCVLVDYFATGRSAGYLDALSLRFDLGGTLSAFENPRLRLRMYVKKGAYAETWHAMRLYEGAQNPQDQDCDASSCWGTSNEFPSDPAWEGWVTREVPLAWLAGSTLDLTVRIWNAKVDAAILDVSDAGSWSNITPSGTLPPTRREGGVAYDSQGDRLIVIGGAGGGSATWMMNLAGTPTWTSVAGGSPPDVSGDDRAVYDPINNRVVLVTGSMQAWALDLANPTAWVLLATGSPPPARSFYATTYDALRNRLLLFGGGPYTGLFNDVWALPLSGTSQIWTQIVGAGQAPAPRWGPTAAYDAARDRLIITSGSLDGSYAVSSDSWALSLGGTPTWNQLSPTGPAPQSRMLASATYDPVTDRVLLYGGYSGPTNVALGDVWSLGLEEPDAWTQLSPTGTVPAPRWSHGAVFRTAIPQMLIFGGWTGGSGLNDAWALDLGPSTGPPVLLGFQPNGGRIGDPVVVGGVRLGAATNVEFNGVSAPILSATYGEISTQVPVGATTGPIRVVTPEGESVSAEAFFVGETPVVDSANPNSGKVGSKTVLEGMHFTGATRVSFGGSSGAAFTIVSDNLIEATVDSLATTGPISITTPAATGTSSFGFTVLEPDTSARIFSIRDVPADQGGHVTVRWLRSDLDQAPRREISGYRVWRRAPADLAANAIATHPTWRREVTPAGEVVFWEPLTVVPASYLEGYAFVAPTTRDSIPDSNPYTAFFIQALTADPYVFYNSIVDSGYSVDNLAPRRPRSLTAEYRTSANLLHWGGNVEPDLREYRLYRGDHLAFVPGADNLIYAGLDTMLVDTASPTGVYKLSAVDVHGNESRFALATPTGSTTGVAFAVTAQAEPTSVTLDWYVIGLPSATVSVYRRTEGSSWQVMATVIADAVGMVHYRDVAVQPGQHLGYRLGMMDGDVEVFSDETWVTVPEARLALLGIAPNPVVGDAGLKVRLSLPQAALASLQVVDISGRVVARQSLRSLGAGIHEVRVTWERQPSPGIYWVRLTQGGRSVAMKVGVLT